MATDNIGKLILDRRRELGWTQEELAKKMGYKTKSAINKIELGISGVSTLNAKKFAEVLGVSVGYLLGKEKPQPLTEKLKKDPKAVQLLEAYWGLNERDRDILLAMANTMSENNN